MIRTSWRLAPVLAALVAVSALGSGAADAETATARDGTHDVVRITRQHPAQSTPAPDVDFADLTGDRVSYRRDRIHVVVHVRRLDRSRATFAVALHLKYGDPHGFLYADTDVVVSNGNWSGRVTQSFVDPGCPVDHTVDYRHDRVSISFPSSCLGTPRWVKVQAVTSAKESPGVFDYDDMPLQHGKVGRYGVRVHRG